MWESPGSPSARRASRGVRLSASNCVVSPRGSIGRVSVDRGHDVCPIRSHQREASRRVSGALATSMLQFIDAGDVAGFEKIVLDLSSQLARAFLPERAAGPVGDARSPVLVAVKGGNLRLVQAVLKWVPEAQAATVMNAKDESDGQTVLMISAANGDPEVFEAVASRLPRTQVLQLLKAQCVRGNTVALYAVQTGRASMIEATIAKFPHDEVVDALCVKNFLGETPLMHAARAPEAGAFRVVANKLPTDQLTLQLETQTEEGHTALLIATRAGNVPTWKTVASRMSATEVNRQLVSTDIYGETAVMLSIRSCNNAMFLSVVGRFTKDQVLTQLGTRNAQGQTPAQVAVACNAETVLAAMIRPGWISACVLDAPDESEAQLTALDLAVRPPAKLSMVRCLLACGATPTARVVLKLVRNSRDIGGLAAVRACFLGAVAASEWAINPLIPGLNVSVALVEAKRQSPDFRKPLTALREDVDALVLSVLSHLPDTVAGFDRLATAATAPADDATRRARVPSTFTKASTGRVAVDGDHVSAGKGSMSSTITRWVPGRRPKNGEGDPAPGVGITLVQEMLEPELAGLQPRYSAGPLAHALQSRHLEFICMPLVVDYLRLKFGAGLPNPFRETDWRREDGRIDRDLARFMLDEDESKLRVYILQGGCADSPSWTYLPGLQFILAGVVGKTEAFFGVPAMRLALDVLVYGGVITVFVAKVVVLKDAGMISPWEILWLVYILGAIWQQVREVQEAGSVRTHFFNPWNIVEVITLATLAVAFFFRTWAFVCDGHGMLLCGELSTGAASVSDLNEVYLAQYFQAASAPFVLGKVLFLTQIHSSLGPLMHSTFRMFTDLARFGALMLVIILGFTVAFYAMFGSRSAPLPDGGDIAAYDTYYSSLLTLFGSMLGSFDFSVFDDAPMGEAGVVLLVFFLCVMNVTLLNLLIAILATAHGRVEQNADKEAMLSEALIITQYRRAMRSDSLPAPLNVPQEFISHLFWRHKERSKEIFARGVFWLISGPIAITATAILWVVSLPLTLAWAGRVVRSSGTSMLVPSLFGISFSLGVAPIVTTWLWLQGVVGIWRQGQEATETSDRNEIEASRAHRRGTYGGAPSSPIARIASAAVAASQASTAIAPDGVDKVKVSPSGNDGDASTIKSMRWKRAAGIGVGVHDGDSVYQQRGFDVGSAVRAVHGLTIQQLKERLDKREKTNMEQRDEVFAEALAGLKMGHERLEEMIRKGDEKRAKLETKIGDLLNAFASNRDKATPQQTAAEATTSPEAVPEGGTNGGQGRDDDRRGSNGSSLDNFIDQYHTELSRC